MQDKIEKTSGDSTDRYIEIAERLISDHLKASESLKIEKLEEDVQDVKKIPWYKRYKHALFLGSFLILVLIVYFTAFIYYHHYQSSQVRVNPKTMQLLKNDIIDKEFSLTQKKVDQNLTEFTFNRGISFLSSNDFNEALPMFEKVINLDPTFVPAYVNGAYASIQLGDFVKATTYLQKAEKLNPNNPRTLYMLGVNYGMQGDLTRAFLYLNRVIALAPGDEFAIKAQNLIDSVYIQIDTEFKKTNLGVKNEYISTD